MNLPHKFKAACNGVSYDYCIFCEYCGLIAFDANRTSKMKEQQEKAAGSCPNSPTAILAKNGDIELLK